YDFHLAPVIGKFFAAIEADYVRSGHRRGFAAPRPRTQRNRKTVMRVPTPEESIQHSRHHFESSPLTPPARKRRHLHLLRFSSGSKGSTVVRITLAYGFWNPQMP